MKLTISLLIKIYLTKTNFPLWHALSRNILNAKKAQLKIEKIFDDSFQMKDDASPKLKQLIRSVLKTEENINKTMQHVFLRAKEENWLGGDQVALRNGRSVLPLKASQK